LRDVSQESNSANTSHRRLIYDFKNPADVIAWYRIWPKRHGEQLKWLAKHRPELAWSIKEAGRLLRG